MRSIGTITCITFATSILFASDQATSKWTEYKFPEGGFKVLLPVEPKKFSQDSQSEFGKTVLHFHVCEHDGVMYLTNYADAPEDAKKQKVDSLLDACREGALKNSRGKLLNEKKLKLGEHLGREVTIAQTDGMVFRARAFLVDWRLYQLVVVGPKDKVESTSVNAYYESFQLLKKE